MIRFFQSIIWGCIVLLLTGCSVPEEDKPVWEQIKIGDLAASAQADRPPLEIVKFEIYIFEVPAEKIGALDEIWKVLYKKPLQFDSLYAFEANLFSVGFGQIKFWDKTGDLLRAAGGRKVETVSIFLANSQHDDLNIMWLDKEQTVFYVSAEGTMKSKALGPGKIALRIKAEKIPGSRGLAEVSFQPVFSLPTKTDPVSKFKAGKGQAEDFVFTSTGFKLKMCPGEFLFLAPKEYVSRQSTLGSLFFSMPGRRPAIRTFLFLCTAITY